MALSGDLWDVTACHCACRGAFALVRPRAREGRAGQAASKNGASSAGRSRLRQQPFVIYGYLRTVDEVAPILADAVLGSLAMFVAV